MFILDTRLQEDTWLIGDFPLCRLLLSNDSNYPWFILVPRREGISELFQLDDADQQLMWAETTALAGVLKELFTADKMNVATLGNVVSQLHMHVIARYASDAAWPGPVWGKHPAKPYSEADVQAIRDKLKAGLGAGFTFVEGKTVSLEERVMDLESRLAFQDDTIQALNDVLVSQQNAVDRLQLQIAALLKRQEEMGGQFESFEDEAPPPHY
ncbi:HIT domain-containing protein [Pseudomonas helleri]|uniref:Protein SlyX homolog n=1 Tax=Pseudomonas helleri TaxID=1608996 RepID=A0A6L5HSJ1_9PSED|nr:HIT domain-containing protein [Pseudomonas helleri]